MLTFVRRPLALAFALALAEPASYAQPRPDASPPVAGSRPACVAVSAQPFFNGSGYNHLVHVHNQCAQPVSCTVTTNVNPRPATATLAASERRTFNTFFNAAGYGFTATVQCAEVRR